MNFLTRIIIVDIGAKIYSHYWDLILIRLGLWIVGWPYIYILAIEILDLLSILGYILFILYLVFDVNLDIAVNHINKLLIY